ncbi:MAG: DUF4263 domain-containing protein [Candidatus Aminicenantes bacterium]|nr:MAG: DUF4263 domain-containing protein [Candidatus Aminicenantes bacterium]
MKAKKLLKRRSREDIPANTPLKEFFVWWDNISKKDITALKKLLRTTEKEHDLQEFLQNNPIYLIQHMGGGHGRWVIPKQRLGAEHVTDFLIGERHSAGFEWQAVELENPNAPMFTKQGDPSKQLTHAIRQIQDWRAWLQRNQNYASRPKIESGLGLTDIVSTIPGLILIGRRKETDPITNERRRQMAHDLHINIHTYDFLLESAKGRIKALNIDMKKRRIA